MHNTLRNAAILGFDAQCIKCKCYNFCFFPGAFKNATVSRFFYGQCTLNATISRFFLFCIMHLNAIISRVFMQNAFQHATISGVFMHNALIGC